MMLTLTNIATSAEQRWKEQAMKKRIKAHIRKKCRKCGTLLVNKPEYGAVCPKCGWCRGWYTDKDGADNETEKE